MRLLRAWENLVLRREGGGMTALYIIGILPSLLFIAICLYAVVDAERVEKYTAEAWNHERKAL